MVKRPRVAIVSDPLVQRGGAERVVEAMAAAFPDAPIFSVLYSSTKGPASLAARVKPSWLQRVPFAESKHRSFLPLFRSAIESFDLSAFDIVLSSHHTVAKGLLRGADQRHICYCHTPMRALWERSAAEIGSLPALTRPLAHALLSDLRVWDYASAARVDVFVANSSTTARRISSHYGRESMILNPPIDTDKFTVGHYRARSPYLLIASRAVPYKRIDIAIAAAKAAGKRVVLVGGSHGVLSKTDDHVESLGIVDDDTLVNVMRGADGLLFPQYEDFGMTPLEMNACGRPVVALGAGGALETVIDGVTGILASEQTVEAFHRAIVRLDDYQFDPETLRSHAEGFSQRAFVEKLKKIVFSDWDAFRGVHFLNRTASVRGER